MRLWSACHTACCAVVLCATPALAQQAQSPAARQLVPTATTALNLALCYWSGVPYSGGARIRAPQADPDPHVGYQLFTCQNGVWTQE